MIVTSSVQQCEAQIIYTSLALCSCEHIEGSTDFSYQTQFFAVCLNFQQQNPLENEYLPHPLSFENCEINSIESDSSRASNDAMNGPKFQYSFEYQFY